MKVREIRYLVSQTFAEWQEDKASRLAAALSYYTVFSLPPLLVLSLAIAGILFDQQAAREQILAQVGRLVGDTGQEAIIEILNSASDPTLSSVASLLSIALLIFGASGVFTQLQDAMNTIWEVRPRPGRGIIGAIKDRFFSFTMVLSVGFLLMVSLILSTALAAAGKYVTGQFAELELLVRIINFVISLGGIALVFALIFKVIPDVEIAWRHVWLGALVTAGLFNIGKWAISLYLVQSAPQSSYGAAGSLIVVLLWVYYSAQIMFLGAEFTQVFANRFGGGIVASEGAIPLTEKARVHEGIPHDETVQHKEHEAEQDQRTA
jgi:membrane protein